MKSMPNLDFARSVAVLSVVVEHTLLSLHVIWIGRFDIQYLGVMGVFVFFVLTALVLMWSLERKPHTLDFYIRRVFRIYPLAWAAIAVALLFHAPTGGSPSAFFHYNQLSLRELAGQFTLVPNMTYNGPLVVGVMWTLPYELEMYLLLPVLFFFVRKNFTVWPLLLLWAMPVLMFRHDSSGGHNFAVSIAYFLPGIMAYVGFGRWKPRLPAWTLPVFLATTWTLFMLHPNFHTGWYACLLVGLGLPMFRQMRAQWIVVPSKIIAKYSYGIYLIHPFAIVIGIYLLRGHSLWVQLLAEAVPLVVLPVAAYHLLEHPLIQIGARLARQAEQHYEQHELKHFRNATQPVAGN